MCGQLKKPSKSTFQTRKEVGEQGEDLKMSLQDC